MLADTEAVLKQLVMEVRHQSEKIDQQAQKLDHYSYMAEIAYGHAFTTRSESSRSSHNQRGVGEYYNAVLPEKSSEDVIGEIVLQIERAQSADVTSK